MKRVIISFLLLTIYFSAFGQQINGVIYYQNSGDKTAEGVEISAFGCNSVYSNSSGMFTLKCTNKTAGQKVKLVIGGTDGADKVIKVVNTRQLELLRIPDKPDSDPIEIIICYAEQWNETALRFYGILEKNANEEFERKLYQINAKLDNTALTANERQMLINQIDELRKERDAALEKLEEQAQFIASINKDQASDLVKSAIQKIEQEKDIDAALEVLDNAKLEAAYQLALKKKLKAEAEIQQVIEGFELKISLLLPKFKYKEATYCYEKIIEISEANNFDKEKLAVLYLRMALVLNDNGKYKKALGFEKKAIDIQEEVLDSKHPFLATSYNNVAVTYKDLGRYEKALEFHKKAIDIREEVLDSKHPDLANSYNNIAATYIDLEQYEEALEFQKKAVDIREEVLDSKHPDLANSYSNIALTYKDLGQYKRALEFQKKAVDIQEEVLYPKHPNLANSYNNIAVTNIDLGQYEKALEFQKKAIKTQEEILNPKHPDLANSYNNIAAIYKALGQYEEALKFQKKAINIQEEVLGLKHPYLANSYNHIALTYQALGQYEKALVFQEKDIKIQEEILYPKHPHLATSYNNIGLTYAKNKEFDKAHEAFKTFEETSTEKGRTFRNWAMYYALQGEKEKALSNLKKAVALGYKDIEWLKTDNSMDSLRKEKAFIKIIKQLEKQVKE